MDRWLGAALDYVPRWLDFQMQASQQPGCMIAIAHRDKVVLERAFGAANLATGEPLTPRHRFRVASHSKSFAAAGIMRLREMRKLRLDDTAGQFVGGLHRQVAQVTIAQLLSHTAGLIRDGDDAGQFLDRRPYYNARELAADLSAPPIIDPGSRFKYSNHGYGLVGMIIEAITGEPYRAWITREIIDAAGLTETDARHAAAARHAVRARPQRAHPARPPRRHSGRQSDPRDRAGRRIRQHRRRHRALLRAAVAERTPSVLSAASRREMSRRHWRNPMTAPEQHYGLGTISGSLDGWDWFGHSGGLQGYISRTCVYPAQDLTVCVLTNAIDGWAHPWLDGIANILQALRARRATDPQGAGLERALVEPVDRARSRAGRQQGARARARLHRADDQRARARNHRPHHRPDREGARLRQPRRARQLRAHQVRPDRPRCRSPERSSCPPTSSRARSRRATTSRRSGGAGGQAKR